MLIHCFLFHSIVSGDSVFGLCFKFVIHHLVSSLVLQSSESWPFTLIIFSFWCRVTESVLWLFLRCHGINCSAWLSYADPEGGQEVRTPPPPLENHKYIGFLSNTVPHPLKYHKITPSLARQQNAI